MYNFLINFIKTFNNSLIITLEPYKSVDVEINIKLLRERDSIIFAKESVVN